MTTARRLLGRLLMPSPPPFALLRRAGTAGGAFVELLTGEVTEVTSLAGLPTEDVGGRDARWLVTMIPYRQLAERGYACHDDGEPILVLTSGPPAALPLTEVLAALPDADAELRDGAFDLGDGEYRQAVQRVIDGEISAGEGSNFVIRRSYRASLVGDHPLTALGVFRRLLTCESSAYWTFLVHTGERAFVGASPEQHVRLDGGTVRMNPISGTYRYPPAGPDLPGVLAFLTDQKENDELFMVVDEELKMLARVCDDGVRVEGPYLREMARLAHTEYRLRGRTGKDVRDVLRETMFAPTVVGSPLENACRVISRHERDGRGYYSGVAALIGPDEAGHACLDSAIMIRAAEIRSSGALRADVGATLVRHSRPDAEVAETWAKAGALLTAIGAGRTRDGSPPRAVTRAAGIGERPDVAAALRRRNRDLSCFWLDADGGAGAVGDGGPVLIVDAEDMFTGMLGQQMRALGRDVTIRPCASVEPGDLAGFDCVVLGPGPGDPSATDDPRIVRLRGLTRSLLASGRPFVAECLSHQLVAAELGLELLRRHPPNQGSQRQVDLFGHREPVGFYNSYSARHHCGWLRSPLAGDVELCRDGRTGEVHAMRGRAFASTQFHLESVLTRHGQQILAALLRWAEGGSGAPPAGAAVGGQVGSEAV
jgi:phenazine biosynthesis protein phzE